MPVTEGSLTQRLGQMITDIGDFFSTANTKLDTIMLALRPGDPLREPYLADILIATRQALGPNEFAQSNLHALSNLLTTTNARLLALQGAIGTGTEPSLKTALKYLTQAGDGTALQRNLQSLSDEVFRLGGALPNHATLFDLRQALVSPTGPRLQEIVEKLDILLDEKLGTPPNALTGLELLQLVADCVCELNDKFPPVDPPPSEPIIPSSHLCAPEMPLLFEVTPADWYEWAPGLWAACPASLYAGMEQWIIVQREFISGSGGTHPVLRLIDGQRDNALDFCNVTGASTVEIAVLVPQHGRDESIGGGQTRVSFGNGADVVGVTDGPTGCKTIALLNSELPDVYWRLNADLGGIDGSDKPNETYYFYEIVPN